MSESIPSRINKAVEAYFEANPKTEWIKPKDIMPDLIKAGVFAKDHKNGLPLRKVLRELDRDAALDQIPRVHAERKDNNVFWYFVREGGKYSPKEAPVEVSKKQQAKLNRENSDEHYLVGLCNELIGEQASQQHKFGFLLGDYHKDGKKRTALPIDAFYREANLAIEFKSDQTGFRPGDNKITASGVTRTEQRKIYDARKRDVLKEEGIKLIEIQYGAFDASEDRKLTRNKEADLKVLSAFLGGLITK